jgi:hypothetical protein
MRRLSGWGLGGPPDNEALEVGWWIRAASWGVV